MQPENQKLLTESLESIGLAIEPEALMRLVGYHDFLMEYNQKVNLTGFDNERDSVIGNLLNSLTPWRHVDASRATVDIGSGGGLPGIPLAIVLGMSRMTLVESKRKKCDFLVEAVKQFSPTTEVVQSDANMVKRSFGQVVSIAYGALAKLIEATDHMRAPGTRLLAWKGRYETIHVEIAACRKAFRHWKIEKFEVPHQQAERHLCVMQM